MARFAFRLQTLRRLREIHRDDMRARLAEAFEAERILAERRREKTDELTATIDSHRQAVLAGTLDVNFVLATQRYQLVLQAELNALAEQASQLAVEAENRRRAVVEADRQVRVLDKLEERQRRQHADVRTKLEAKQFDEIAVGRWARSRT